MGADSLTVLRFYGAELFAAWVHDTHVHIVWFDGSETRGYPPDDEAFAASAVQLGYVGPNGDPDTYWHIVEHDLCHVFLAQGLDHAPSASIWNQAHDEKAYRRKLTGWMREAVERDEWRVGAMQAALNGKGWGHERLADLLGWQRARSLVASVEDKLRPRGEAMTREWARERAQLTEAGEIAWPIPVGWRTESLEAA